MKDYEDNTEDEVMREHAEENAFRAHYPAQCGRIETYCRGDAELAFPKPTWKCGILFRWGSLWVGAHYAKHHRRWCINLVPCITFWITLPGGTPP